MGAEWSLLGTDGTGESSGGWSYDDARMDVIDSHGDDSMWCKLSGDRESIHKYESKLHELILKTVLDKCSTNVSKWLGTKNGLFVGEVAVATGAGPLAAGAILQFFIDSIKEEFEEPEDMKEQMYSACKAALLENDTDNYAAAMKTASERLFTHAAAQVGAAQMLSASNVSPPTLT